MSNRSRFRPLTADHMESVDNRGRSRAWRCRGLQIKQSFRCPFIAAHMRATSLMLTGPQRHGVDEMKNTPIHRASLLGLRRRARLSHMLRAIGRGWPHRIRPSGSGRRARVPVFQEQLEDEIDDQETRTRNGSLRVVQNSTGRSRHCAHTDTQTSLVSPGRARQPADASGQRIGSAFHCHARPRHRITGLP